MCPGSLNLLRSWYRPLSIRKDSISVHDYAISPAGRTIMKASSLEVQTGVSYVMLGYSSSACQDVVYALLCLFGVELSDSCKEIIILFQFLFYFCDHIVKTHKVLEKKYGNF